MNYESIYYENIEEIKIMQKEFSIIIDESIDSILETLERDCKNEEEIEEFIKHKIPKEQEIEIFNHCGKKESSKKCIRRIVVPPIITNEEILAMVDQLNDKQRKIVIHIYNSFKIGKTPLKIFISGSAGVGKSKVIYTIYQLLSKYFREIPGIQNDKQKILLCAYSGIAAFLIGGITLHTAFALPVTEFKGQMPELSSDIANTIREELNNVELLIIDEIS